jgi:protein-S-isoprenylcysteine O-methyltransferase Ste14
MCARSAQRLSTRGTSVAGVVRSAVFTAVFFVLAPGATAGLVPWLITGWDVPEDAGPALTVLAVVLVALGAAVVVACFVRFVTEGRGTPAPVAPTEELVVGGLYRYVRNPMYVGVATAIAGQALLFRSWPVLVWLAAFLTAVVSFVKVYEEPRLAEQFGESYERYRRSVPGWWPGRGYFR